jgi:hypothetical protein
VLLDGRLRLRLDLWGKWVLHHDGMRRDASLQWRLLQQRHVHGWSHARRMRGHWRSMCIVRWNHAGLQRRELYLQRLSTEWRLCVLIRLRLRVERSHVRRVFSWSALQSWVVLVRPGHLSGRLYVFRRVQMRSQHLPEWLLLSELVPHR